MNITSPILTGAANAAELPGDSVSSFLRAFGAGGPDGGLGIIMSALAGIAAALAVAIMLSVYFRSGYRSRRDLVKHGLAASAVLVLLAFVISDMRNAALAYLGLNPAKPAVEFEIRLPKAALAAATDTQVELLPEPETGQGSGGAGFHRRRPQHFAGHGDARLPYHGAHDGVEPAGPGPEHVPAAAARKPVAIRPVRTVAPRGRHRPRQWRHGDVGAS
jgi:hypothetical protein